MVPPPPLIAAPCLSRVTNYAKKCEDAEVRRGDIDREIEQIERDPKSRNPNGTLYARILELKAERAALPTIYDIDPRFTLAPAGSGEGWVGARAGCDWVSLGGREGWACKFCFLYWSVG